MTHPTLHSLHLTVNGEEHSLTVPAHRTLLDLLRDELHLTGTKKVCDMGNCGACTVLRYPRGNPQGVPVLACLTLAVSCDGEEITTIEGIAGKDGALSPLQQAFIDADGLQCGFCTPGQIVSATALLRENPAPTAEEIKHYMAGNLCRCGAYQGIAEAIARAAANSSEEGPS